MSLSQNPTATASSSNYQAIFDNALEAYRKRTKKDLRSHTLFAKLEACDSPDAVLATLREQISGFDQSGDDKCTKWLKPTVNVLYNFSAAIGGGISLVYPPVGVIFTGIGILLSAATAVSAGQDRLADVFERIEYFFSRLETYIDVPATAGMTEMIVKIMTEVLLIAGIATKEIKQGKAKRYLKKLLGRTDMEDALCRLDRLTQEEVRMAAAQGLKATHEVDCKVQGVDDKIDIVIDGGKKTRDEIITQFGTQNRNQIRRDLKNWLSPPDSSVNYNTASDAHHQGTATWFTESTTFTDWKALGSLLWIHGKPGSGKSVLSSSIIRDIKGISDAGSAHLAYFFFDFKDTGKQDVRALLSSLVIQLSHQSDYFCDILFGYHLTHQSGSQQPSDSTLTQCLEDMLRIPEQVPIYIIIDALDECPNMSGISTPRDKVLMLVEKLVKLKLSNLRLCITSRPEVDIRTSMEPLTSNRISLHDERGQKKDIDDFVYSVVYSDRNMRRWRDADKKMVIETLSERADGMFRWVFCQLETLRQCLPASVRQILAELPETLDATYERILSEIPKSNRVHAHRLLQCLTVAYRPLRVEELAEVLAVDFTAIGGIPQLKEDLRWEDQEQAVLMACSSLIAVVPDTEYRVVQFSHFSVKEFLTSDRLAASKMYASRYQHIQLEEAHTIMAQACLSVLLRLDYDIDYKSIKSFPLAEYAGEHFGDHVEFEGVLSQMYNGVDDLLDAEKPHFAAWLWMWRDPIYHGLRKRGPPKPDAVPLYHLVEFGHLGLVDYLISKRPEDINATRGYGGLLHAASRRGHSEMVSFLDHFLDVDVRNSNDQTPLHMAICGASRLDPGDPVDSRFLEVVRVLIELNADVNSRDNEGKTPLNRLLCISHGDGGFELAKFLLDHGADADTVDNEGSTLLHAASSRGCVKVVQLLLERGGNIHVQNEMGRTPLHRAAVHSSDNELDHYFDAIPFLLDHGADVDARDNDHSTPLHLAAPYGGVKAARPLLEHGANLHAQNKNGRTPLHEALVNFGDYDFNFDIIPFFLEYGADVDVLDEGHSTPLHLAARRGIFRAACPLLEHGANINAKNKNGWTPLHEALVHVQDYAFDFDIIPLFLAHGADLDALDEDHSTPLHLAARSGSVKAVRILLEHGASVHLQNNEGKTALQVALANGHENFAWLYPEHLQSDIVYTGLDPLFGT